MKLIHSRTQDLSSAGDDDDDGFGSIKFDIYDNKRW